MTTQKMYETVLAEFGFTMQEGNFGMEPSLQLKNRRKGYICFATFKVEPHKTLIRLGGCVNTGFIRVSETQLRSLLTIIVQNYF